MAVQLTAEQQVLFGGYRLTGQVNTLGEAMTTAELDATVLGNLTEIKEPGLKGYGQGFEGFWSPTEDGGLIGLQRTRNVPSTLALTTGAAGTRCRMVQAMIAEHEIGEASQGELLPFSYALGSMDAPRHGTLLHNAEATGNVTGTAFNLGAPSGTIRAALHVFSGSGALDVLVQSATDEAFTTPNTRITFTTVPTGTALTYEWAINVAPGTDPWWRISATNPATRDFAVALHV